MPERSPRSKKGGEPKPAAWEPLLRCAAAGCCDAPPPGREPTALIASREPAAPPLPYSLRSASTGSRLLAEEAGMMPAMSVSTTESSTSAAAFEAGSCMMFSTP